MKSSVLIAIGVIAFTACDLSAHAAATIAMEPARLQVCDGTFVGQTKVTWSLTDADAARAVRVHVATPSGARLSTGTGSGSAMSGNWVRNNTKFLLVDARSNQVLAETVADVHAEHCPGITFTGGGTLADCDRNGVESATFTWNAGKISPFVKLYGVYEGKRFQWGGGGATGQAKTDPWLRTGLTVELRNHHGDELLASIPISLQTSSCK